MLPFVSLLHNDEWLLLNDQCDGCSKVLQFWSVNMFAGAVHVCLSSYVKSIHLFSLSEENYKLHIFILYFLALRYLDE